jgi:hypothetical protein
MSLNVELAIGIGGILLFCIMVVFLAWLCVHTGKPKPQAKLEARASSKHTTPAQKLEEKFKQAEIDARRGDSFGSDDDGDGGDGDGDGP